jgi:hypothetical protein
MNEKISFKTRARVLNQLGEQLIKNEAIALLELIKNSYDADASFCNVTLNNAEDPENGEITILDDGEGMDFNTFKTAWLEIGTSYKEDLLLQEETKRSEKFGRLRLGEKGIGRLGVHRLGREIVIISKRAGALECVLKINWDHIDKSRYIEELPFELQKNEIPTFFKTGTGTYIRINRFRAPWSRKMIRECYRSILSLNSPFENVESFRAELKVTETELIKGLLTYAEISEYRLFEFDIRMSGSEIKEFLYRFLPWPTMNKIIPREITLASREMTVHKRLVNGSTSKKIDLSKFRIGEIQFKGAIFDRESNILNLGVTDKTGLKEYLNLNGGIRVFRDNMRVLDYGEPGNDWLDLAKKRVNQPTKRISNNIIIGSVFLKRETSGDLKEKANREGFVETEAFDELCGALLYALERVESLRQIDKEQLRKFYSSKSAEQPIISSISSLKDIVETKIKEEPVRKEIYRYLDRIETDYDQICNNLMKSAGAGLNLIVVIHQIEKIIKDVKQMLKQKTAVEHIEKRVKVLAELIDGYSILVKKSSVKVRNLKGVLEQCVFNTEFRLEAHGIELESKFRDRNRNLDAICSEDHFLNALMNLFDNAIWWLGYSRTEKPSIYLDISNELPGFVSVVIADNGPGFTIPTEEAIKPFVSDKNGGMGIGLHLTDQIMKSLGGKLLFPDNDDIFTIPQKYQKGAIIALAFRKDGAK